MIELLTLAHVCHVEDEAHREAGPGWTGLSHMLPLSSVSQCCLLLMDVQVEVPWSPAVASGTVIVAPERSEVGHKCPCSFPTPHANDKADQLIGFPAQHH
jgi:hypothetical protein